MSSVSRFDGLRAVAAVAGISIGSAAVAAEVYVLSSGDLATDDAAVAALTLHGHSVTLGVPYPSFDGTQNLSGFDTVYLQANANWTAGLMPTTGQQALIDFVNGGGRLVNCEWVTYYSHATGNFASLASILPLVHSFTYATQFSTTYDQQTPDPAVNAGLPPGFLFPLTSYTGTEVYTTAKPGATVYYTTSNSPGAAGLAGWQVGAGTVFSFTSTCGPDQVQDSNFGRLFANVMGEGGEVCYANCDGSTIEPVLNVDDFTCFINEYAAAQSLPHQQQLAHYANCDGSQVAPALNVDDFTCFINAYAAGCR